MKTFRSKGFGNNAGEHHEAELFSIYLSNKLFRGFYYDSDERSYGIVLNFSQPDHMELYAQESKAGSSLIEYKLASDHLSIEQKAYDKLVVSAEIQKKVIVSGGRIPDFPKKIEFTVQVLTRNSIYIRFLNKELFAPPISSFHGGLVLSKDYNPVGDRIFDIEVEAEAEDLS